MFIKRLFKILYIIKRYNLLEHLNTPKTHIFKTIFFCLPPFNTKQKLDRGTAIKLALEDLGPIFIKFGQILSTRQDLIAQDITAELSLLQDKVKPFSGKIAKNIIETSLSHEISDIFNNFNSTPLASASVAQVHTAQLKDNTQIVIKIIRPNIKKVINQDIKWLKIIARLLPLIYPDSRRLNLINVVKNYHHTITEELDLTLEATKASRLKRNFKSSTLLYIPKIYWEYTTKNLLVLERIDGIHVSDIKKLTQYKIDREKLAKAGIEIFVTQVFRDGFFHADMHPGNIFVSKKNPDNPSFLGVDFGIVGSLSEQNRLYILQLLMAFFDNDCVKIAQIYIHAGWVSNNTDLDKLAMCINKICEPMFAQSFQNISYGSALMNLFHHTKEFNLTIQPDLILFQKTLFHIEGLGKTLAPDMDIFSHLIPLLKQIFREKFGIKNIIRKTKQQYPQMLQDLNHIYLAPNPTHSPSDSNLSADNKKYIYVTVISTIIILSSNSLLLWYLTN